MTPERDNARVRRCTAALRVTALLVLLGNVGVGVFAVRAHARAHELMQSAGASLLAYARADHVAAPSTLVLNGTPLHLMSGSTTDSIRALLDTFHARCRRVGGRFGEPLLERQPRLGALAPPARAALDGVLRLDSERSGYIACLDLGNERVSPTDLISRVRAFLATGDLAKIGDLRFAWTSRDPGRTSYVALWSESSVPLRSMFPPRGDAPGEEIRDLPRPDGSRRVLSAWQQGEAPILVVYRARRSAAELAQRYGQQLTALGWVVERQTRAPGTPTGLLVRRGRTVILAIASDDGHNAAELTLTPLR